MVEMDGVSMVFGVLSVLIVLSGLLVVVSKNPVHSVFFLVLVFTMSGGLVLLLNMEFLSMVFIVVYVGAMAVLFLFVVMMLNISLVELEQLYFWYLPIGGVVGMAFFYELYLVLTDSFLHHVNDIDYNAGYIEVSMSKPNVYMLGEILYTYSMYEFIIAGIILLVSMIGTMVITLNHQVNVWWQEVYKQVGSVVTTVVKKMS